jgi:hypothetical protein
MPEPLDLDSIIETVLPWQVEVRVGGEVYRTRRATVGEVGALLALRPPPENATGDERNKHAAHALALIGNLFVEPLPNLGHWSASQIGAFISYYVARVMRGSEKNSRAIAAAASAAAMAELEPAEPAQ